MGKDLPADPFNPRDRGRHRRKVQRCLDTLARMLSDGSFSFPRKHIGLEVELNLVDKDMQPSMSNLAVLDAPSYLHLAYRPGVPLVTSTFKAGIRQLRD